MMPGKELHQSLEVLEPNLVNVAQDLITDDPMFGRLVEEMLIEVVEEKIENLGRIGDERSINRVDH